MSQWDEIGNRMQSGPREAASSTLRVLLIAFGLVILPLGVVTSIVGYVGGWFREAAVVAQEQFGPRELLRKYEWFKDAAAALDKKQADLSVYESRLKALDTAYVGQPRGKWSRDDREQSSIWQSECAGVAASFNSLAADYNAQMAKFNWRFCEAGRQPDGSATPLPREFKPYLVK